MFREDRINEYSSAARRPTLPDGAPPRPVVPDLLVPLGVSGDLEFPGLRVLIGREETRLARVSSSAQLLAEGPSEVPLEAQIREVGVESEGRHDLSQRRGHPSGIQGALDALGPIADLLLPSQISVRHHVRVIDAPAGSSR